MSALSFTSMSAGPVLVLMSQYPQARQAIMRLYRIASTKSYVNKLTDQGDKPVGLSKYKLSLHVTLW